MEMDGGDDGDHAVAGLKSALDESLQDVQERSIVLVNVNYVLGKNHLTPEVKGTGLINRHLPRRSLVDFHWKSKNCLHRKRCPVSPSSYRKPVESSTLRSAAKNVVVAAGLIWKSPHALRTELGYVNLIFRRTTM